MRKALNQAILLLSAFVFMGCNKTQFANVFSPSHEPQQECGFVLNVYGERISWKNQTPITLSVHESVPQQFYPALEAAIKDWETSLGRPIFQIREYGVKGPLQPRQDGVNLIYWMNSWEQNRSSEQARTSVYWIGDEIREADIRLNAKDFAFYVSDPENPRDVHLESLLVHELGHVLGLKHRDTGGSVMATYLAAETVRSEIGKIDVDSIRCEY